MAAVCLTAALYVMVQKTSKKNRILSQNLRLSMNTRKTMRNNNMNSALKGIVAGLIMAGIFAVMPFFGF